MKHYVEDVRKETGKLHSSVRLFVPVRHKHHVEGFIARPGKTRRDKESGAWARRVQNQQLRADWQHEGKGRSLNNFPYHVCNGKKNKPFKQHKAR